jgi:thioesterase domain-containing protein
VSAAAEGADPGRRPRLSPAKRSLLRQLREQPAASPREVAAGPAVLRDGNGSPAVVLVHPSGGALFCYAQLVAGLAGDVPVYGFADDPEPTASAERDGRRTERTVPSLAHRYLGLLRRSPVRRSWLLGGWSFGGVVAYEMARQAAGGGMHPVPVVMVDSAFVPPAEQGQPTGPVLRRWFARDLARLAGVPSERIPVSYSDGQPPAGPAVADTLEELIARTGAETGFTAAELERRYLIFRANALALEAYTPEPYDGPVTLIRAERSPDATASWQQFVRHPVRTHIVPGDHYTLLAGDSAARVAGIVDQVVQLTGLSESNFRDARWTLA